MSYSADRNMVKKRTIQTKFFKDDIEYIYQIKHKLEKMLDDMILYFGLSDYISNTKLYRIDMDKLNNNTKFKKLFEEQRDFKGNKLSFEDRKYIVNLNSWFYYNFQEYYVASEIYNNIIEKKSVRKDDLIELNSIYNKLFK